MSATVRLSTPSVPSPGPGIRSAPPLILPRLAFSPTRPQADAGMRIEPPPSEAWAIGARPVATAAAAPPLEPPAERLRSQGVRAAGAPSGSV